MGVWMGCHGTKDKGIVDRCGNVYMEVFMQNA